MSPIGVPWVPLCPWVALQCVSDPQFEPDANNFITRNGMGTSLFLDRPQAKGGMELDLLILLLLKFPLHISLLFEGMVLEPWGVHASSLEAGAKMLMYLTDWE